jgi:hypothetical protein
MGESAYVCCAVVEAPVQDVDQPELFEIRVRVSPASTTVDPDAMCENLGQYFISI